MYIREVYLTALKRVLEPRGMIQILLGPRQVGKTTAAHYISEQITQKHGMNVWFCAADEPELKDRDWLLQQWKLAREKCKKLKTPCLLIVDEVQKIEDWSELVKNCWDEDTAQSLDLRVLLMGSSTLLIHKGLNESLAGRFEIIRVSHWLHPEMREAFQHTWEDWVYFGGYPGSARLKQDPQRWASYIRDALIETTLSKDILLLDRVEKPALLRRLFQLGCRYSAEILSFQKMMSQLVDAGNATTLAHYLELLSQAGLLTGLQKYSGSFVREKASSPKFQVLNPALMSALDPLSFEEIRSNGALWGRMVESAVGAHLANAIVGKNMELMYWRDRNLEVDFVLKSGDRCVGFEIKSGKKKEGHTGLKEFKKRFNPIGTWMIGDDYGLSFEQFFSTPIEHWWRA